MFTSFTFNAYTVYVYTWLHHGAGSLPLAKNALHSLTSIIRSREGLGMGLVESLQFYIVLQRYSVLLRTQQSSRTSYHCSHASQMKVSLVGE